MSNELPIPDEGLRKRAQRFKDALLGADAVRRRASDEAANHRSPLPMGGPDAGTFKAGFRANLYELETSGVFMNLSKYHRPVLDAIRAQDWIELERQLTEAGY